MVQKKYTHAFLAICLALLFLLFLVHAPRTRIDAPTVRVTSVTNLGILTGTPPNVSARDVATTGLFGSQILWAFGDTFITPPPPHETPADWRSSTTAHSSLSHPFALTELEEHRGFPSQLIPYTQDELNYNRAKHNPGGDRLALWPSAVLATDAHDAEIVYTKVHILGALNYQTMGTGTAHLAIFQQHATRDFRLDPVSGLTFRGRTIPFGSSGGRLTPGPLNDTVYLYSCTNALADNCYIARVQAPHGSNDGTWGPLLVASAHYQTWNGSTWTADLMQARPAQHLEASAMGWSMAYNPYVRNPVTGQPGAFLGLYNQITAFGKGVLPTNNVMLVTAASPEGPWSDPILAFPLTPETKQLDYGVQIHAELTSSDGRTLYVTYAHPAPSEGFLHEEVKLVQLTLQNT
jgi:hypothetical protein